MTLSEPFKPGFVCLVPVQRKSVANVAAPDGATITLLRPPQSYNGENDGPWKRPVEILLAATPPKQRTSPHITHKPALSQPTQKPHPFPRAQKPALSQPTQKPHRNHSQTTQKLLMSLAYKNARTYLHIFRLDYADAQGLQRRPVLHT